MPLVALVFATIYLYDAREFTELLLAQPIRRRQLFAGLYLGLALPLSLVSWQRCASRSSCIAASRTPSRGRSWRSSLAGSRSRSLHCARVPHRRAHRGSDQGARTRRRLVARARGALRRSRAAARCRSSPTIRSSGRLLALMLANPMDLASVLLLLRFDVAALLGYTGAVMQQFFGRSIGVAVTSLALVSLGIRAVSCRHARVPEKDF